MSRKLVLFALEFPGQFLEAELPYLLSAFDSVFIVAPKVRTGIHHERLFIHQIKSPYHSGNSISVIKKHFLRALRIYSYSLISKEFPYYIRYYRSFLGYLLKELELVDPLIDFIEENGLEEALFYDFWLVDATLALAELKRKGVIKKSVARSHGFDLYDERQFEKRLSFRNYRIKYLNEVYAISEHGAAYLKERVKEKFRHKIKVSYLGVSHQLNLLTIDASKENGYYTIVSCAHMAPLKRIHFIVKILKSVQLPILWVHFGDGPEMDRVRLDAGGFPSHVKYELKGNVGNAEVLDFYRTHPVDLFISLSESEGLPVSMMEAISFGIPIFACCVGGVKEIVNSETGVLCSPHDTVDEMGDILVNVLTKRKFDRARIVDFYKGHFDAEKNYRSFMEELQKIG